MLDPGWFRAHHRGFDVFHLHFGFDAQSPAALTELVAELQRFRKPLVYTAHDLRNRTSGGPEPHRQALDMLVPAADRLITLTAGAAAAISARWGRSATVLPHPHVVEAGNLRHHRPVSQGFTIGLHLKSLRPNMAALPVLRALVAATRPLRDAVLRVDVHPEIANPAAHCYAPNVVAELRKLSEAGRSSSTSTTTSTTTSSWSTCAHWTCPCCPTPSGPLGLAGGVLRPRHGRIGPGLRLLPAPSLPELPAAVLGGPGETRR